MTGAARLALVWACLAAGLASGLLPVPSPAAPANTGVPLPSDEGVSLQEAWPVAWALANATTGGPWQLHGLDGYESVRGFGPNWTYGGRSDLEAGAEALDGRIQADGFWQFLFRGGAGHAMRVVVSPDAQAQAVPVQGNAAFLVHPVVAAPRFDTPAAALDCRRLGADEFLSEMDETFLYYFARPLQDEPGQWMLFIIFGSLVDAPGEIESASCRLHQGTGALEYVDTEAAEKAARS
ncbi:MAG TPA: hypothetical protein VM327_07400 [Candidatus Thermoplasmatota archaeon]|nr:hypothetical protein [Candidatus Thermoplasmatota archaeon]